LVGLVGTGGAADAAVCSKGNRRRGWKQGSACSQRDIGHHQWVIVSAPAALPPDTQHDLSRKELDYHLPASDQVPNTSHVNQSAPTCRCEWTMNFCVVAYDGCKVEAPTIKVTHSTVVRWVQSLNTNTIVKQCIVGRWVQSPNINTSYKHTWIAKMNWRLQNVQYNRITKTKWYMQTVWQHTVP